MKSFLFSLFLFTATIQAQEFQWVGRISSAGDDRVTDVATDKFGNVFTVGILHTDTDFNPSTTASYSLTAAQGSDDVYVQKLDSAGNFLWAKRFGGNEEDRPGKVAVDDSGNVYITGKISKIVDLDPGVGVYNLGAANNTSGFVVKLNANGDFLWAKAFTGGQSQVTSIGVDKWNNIYLGGIYTSNIDFDPDSSTVYTLPFSDGLFLCKLDQDGNFKWVKGYDTGFDVYTAANDIATDANGHVCMTGIYRGSQSFLPTIVDHSGVFILKLDTGGNSIWVKTIAGNPNSSIGGNTIGMDASGDVYIGGYFGQLTDFNPDPAIIHYAIDTNNASGDAFILKLRSNGTFDWVRILQGYYGRKRINALALSNDGFVYSTGYFEETIDFNNGPPVSNLSPKGGSDIFIWKLDTAGNFVWAKGIGQTEYDYGIGIDVNNNGELFTVGTFKRTVDFNTDDSLVYNLGPAQSDEVFILKMSNNPCSNLTLVIDSLQDVTCANPGKIWSHALNGFNFTYTWNTTPVTTTATLTTPSSGMHTVTVKDGLLCQRSATIVLPGPTAQQGYDLNANLIAGDFRTGFHTFLQLDALNEGCIPATGQLRLILDNLVHYDSSSVTPSIVSGDTLVWDFIDLAFDSAHITPRVYITTSLSAHAGDTVCLILVITPDSTDTDTTNNIKQYCYRTINAFDPNYIAVYPQGKCVPAYVQKSLPLTYTIHFQNTGNSHAINVYLLDTISTKLDINTVNVIAQSHNVITEVVHDNVLKFRLNNIMLIDSATHPDSSQGYVVYEIMPLAGASENTLITNRAAIYFDFNEAVITNNVSNTLVTGPVDSAYCDVEVGISTLNEHNITIYPNPNTGRFTIGAEGALIENITITDISGRLAYTNSEVNSSTIHLELNQVSGIYFVAVQHNGLTTTHKLLKY